MSENDVLVRVDLFSVRADQTRVYALVACKFFAFREQRRGKEYKVGRVGVHHIWPQHRSVEAVLLLAVRVHIFNVRASWPKGHSTK